MDTNSLFHSKLDEETAHDMVRMVNDQEVKEAMFSMGNDKSPGPDARLLLIASKKVSKCWLVQISRPLSQVEAYRIIFFLPKSLCITITWIGDLRDVLLKLIFKKHMIRWRFLKEVLIGFGFHDRMIGWIMECVSSTSFSISINGSLHGCFKGKRGLRQGDPLSPYLFTLIMEILTLMIKRRVRGSEDFTYHRYCSKLELVNLCFVDDLFLFAYGDASSARVIVEALDELKNSSGLTPSLPKSTAYFCNVLNHVKLSILQILPFEEGCLPVKYLGVPLVSSIAGRLQLDQSVIGSLHVFWALVFILPNSILLDIEQIMRGFLWCQESMRRGKAKVACDVVCLPKDEGGLGIRRLKPNAKSISKTSTVTYNITLCSKGEVIEFVTSYKAPPGGNHQRIIGSHFETYWRNEAQIDKEESAEAARWKPRTITDQGSNLNGVSGMHKKIMTIKGIMRQCCALEQHDWYNILSGKLEFENVYFVKELKYNLFSVSQICDNKNSVLFTDSEYQTTSPEPIQPDTTIPSQSHSDISTPKRFRGTIRISQSKVLSPGADETASPTRDDIHGEAFPIPLLRCRQYTTKTSRIDGYVYQLATATLTYEATDSESRSRNHSIEEQRIDQGEDLIVVNAEINNEKSTEKGSDSTYEMANVLSTLGAANVLSSGGTASTPAGVATASGSFPTAAIFTTASVTTPYTRKTRASKGIIIKSSLPYLNLAQSRSYQAHKASYLQNVKEENLHVWKQMQDFMPMNSKLESKRVKRPGIQLIQESSKKLKTAKASGSEPSQEQQTKEPKELSEEELKKMMEIVPVEEFYIEALQAKYPIIDWEIYSEEQRKYWKIIRVGNHTEVYQIFEEMLKKFDREDLDRLWSLVKKTFSTTDPTEDKEKELWVELKRLYEPDPRDQLCFSTAEVFPPRLSGSGSYLESFSALQDRSVMELLRLYGMTVGIPKVPWLMLVLHMTFLEKVSTILLRKTLKSIIAKLVVAATAYFIWQERNSHLFKNVRRTVTQVIDCIMNSARLKLLSCRLKKTNGALELTCLEAVRCYIYILMLYNVSSSAFAHHMGSTSGEQIEHLSQLENTNSRHNAMDSLVLVCCKDALCVYPLKSMVQIFVRPRTGECNLFNVDIMVGFQGYYGEDYELYGEWADYYDEWIGSGVYLSTE
ncbi:hypothetical protein Tco_0838117 [Tanacetum coccineum]|uniref:Reverse transcriptase domain-containing protein n=1 Tax=Tanacetum coccineum TaxID=301880 RepID=A0ABQ5ALU9_9ASTR